MQDADGIASLCDVGGLELQRLLAAKTSPVEDGQQLADANFREAFLDGPDFRDANLTRANLIGAHLEDADLSDACLRDADLTRADLSETVLSDADLTGADLTRTDLTGAILASAKWPERRPVPEGWNLDPSTSRLIAARTDSRPAVAIRGNGHLSLTDGASGRPALVLRGARGFSGPEWETRVMAGADDGAGPGTGRGWRWDVALSFAGAQREYVEQVARALQEQGVRCFYDADEQIELWGKYLAEELPDIYGEQAAAVVVFVSAEYAARDWTRHERRAALARAVRERREYVLPARFDDTPLPGLLSDMVTVNLRAKAPQQFAAVIAAKLAALGITSAAAAENPAQDARAAQPTGAVRVTQADPRQLGVHAAISVPGVPDEVPPEYVPRDADAGGHGVRARVAAAAARGGFVLLVGGSSVGKTRCAAETVRALLPDWWLVHPDGPGEVAALAAASPARTVVWLDELQRYLDGEHGLTGGVLRALLNAPGPVVIIGTLWPDRYTAYTAVPSPGGADPHSREREVLGLAAVVRIGAAFSAAEQDRARAAAARDRRLAEALGAAGYGLTQTLAAAPQLVARWQDAQAANPYAWAVMTAALDAARLGARAPLPAGLLRAAAPGYCTSAQRPSARQLVRAGAGLRHRKAARRRRRPSPGRDRHGPARWVCRGGLPDPARQPGTPLCPCVRQHLGRHPQPHRRSRRRCLWGARSRPSL